MTRRIAMRWLALALLMGSLVMVASILVSLALPGSDALPDRPSPSSLIAGCAIFIALPSVGAILAIRRPANPIGWLFLLCGAGFTFGIFSTEYVGRSMVYDLRLPAVQFVDWVGSWVGVMSIAVAATWVPLLFPDGHLPSPRWRPVAWAAGVLVVFAFAPGLIPTSTGGYPGRLANPFGQGGVVAEVTTQMGALAFPLLAITSLLSLASLVVRFRRSSGVERAQLKWFLSAVAMLIFAVVTALITQIELAWHAVMFGLAALPIAAGIAVERYRLYEIDRLVSRTISWAAVTTILVAIFVGSVLALQALLVDVTQGETLAVAASTLVAFALFQPIRQRVQGAVDRRFFRARYDAERTTAALAARLRGDVDLGTVRSETLGTVVSAVRPTSADVWIREGRA